VKEVLQSGGSASQKNDKLWLEAAALFLLALAIRFVNLDHTALHDELYHVLAARSWLDQGVFAIDGGSYTRGSLFTMLVAGFFSVFGESLYVARLPAVIAGSLLVVVVYLWTRWSMGRPTALLASLFLIFSPLAIYLSQYARFYSLQGFVFASAAFIFYFLVCSKSLNIVARTGLLAVVAALLALGTRLQIITLVGIAGMALWFFCYALYRYLQLPRNLRRPWALLLVAFGGAGLVLLAAIVSGKAAPYLELLMASPYWANAGGGSNSIRFYHYWLLEEYPAFWVLFPLTAVFALVRRPAPTAFSLTLFVVAFIVHSLAGYKAFRYVGYVMPFLFIVWACALVEFLPYLRKQVSRLVDHEIPPLHRLLRPRFQSQLIVSLVAVFLLLATPAFPLAYRMLTRSDAAWPEGSTYRGAADWRTAAEALQDRISEKELLLTTSGVMALYYLGRYDIEINASNLSETASATEFSLDHRTGHPVVASPRSLQVLMSCYPRGVIVAEERRFRHAPNIVPLATAELIEKNTVALQLPRQSKMVAYRWINDVAESGAKCSY